MYASMYAGRTVGMYGIGHVYVCVHVCVYVCTPMKGPCWILRAFRGAYWVDACICVGLGGGLPEEVVPGGSPADGLGPVFCHTLSTAPSAAASRKSPNSHDPEPAFHVHSNAFTSSRSLSARSSSQSATFQMDGDLTSHRSDSVLVRVHSE